MNTSRKSFYSSTCDGGCREIIYDAARGSVLHMQQPTTCRCSSAGQCDSGALSLTRRQATTTQRGALKWNVRQRTTPPFPRLCRGSSTINNSSDTSPTTGVPKDEYTASHASDNSSSTAPVNSHRRSKAKKNSKTRRQKIEDEVSSPRRFRCHGGCKSRRQRGNSRG
jgi:hypothetical protein